jgi:hypothetical protein
MTKRGFAIEKHDGRRGKRRISDGEASAGGWEKVAFSDRGSRWLAIGDGQGGRPPQPSLAILQPLLNSTSLLFQWRDHWLS